MSSASPVTHSALTLRHLRLRPGMFLQAHPPQHKQRSTEAKFCAAIEGKGLMVVPLNADTSPDWRDGNALTVHGFTGQYDFSFESRVLGSFSIPFAYVLLSYPSRLEARQVRSALRIRTSIMAMAWGKNDSATVPARLIDLSGAGAMLELASPLGAINDEIHVAFSLDLDYGSEKLELRGKIAHTGEGDAGSGTRVGVAFSELPKREKLLLQNFTLRAAQGSGVVD